MRSTSIMPALAIICVFFCITPSSAMAQDLTHTFRADSIMDGNPGTIFRILEPGNPGQDLFIFEEDGKYRIYALRVDGSSWLVLTAGMYYSPVASMMIGETWRFIDHNDLVDETLATVVAQEDVTTAAGTFSCYKVEIHVVANPGVIVQTNWLSEGNGLIRESYFEGNGYWVSELNSYSATGTGFMPRVVGNIWYYSGDLVSTQETSWGKIKLQAR